MAPFVVGMMGVGLLMKGYGQYKANLAQADSERLNASFYREQAAFAREAGNRQEEIFNRESQILYGEQMSAFAKAGLDTSNTSLFMAKEMLQRDREAYAIRRETDMNVRLAELRAQSSEQTASALSSGENNLLQFGGTALSGLASVL